MSRIHEFALLPSNALHPSPLLLKLPHIYTLHTCGQLHLPLPPYHHLLTTHTHHSYRQLTTNRTVLYALLHPLTCSLYQSHSFTHFLPVMMTYFATHHTLLNMDNATYNSPQTQFNFANCNTILEGPHIMTLWYPGSFCLYKHTEQTLHGSFTLLHKDCIYQLI